MLKLFWHAKNNVYRVSCVRNEKDNTKLDYNYNKTGLKTSGIV